jgi:hypothetical protein
MDEFEADAKRVAHALVDGPYPAWNDSLLNVVDTKEVDANARMELARLREGNEPLAVNSWCCLPRRAWRSRITERLSNQTNAFPANVAGAD